MQNPGKTWAPPLTCLQENNRAENWPRNCSCMLSWLLPSVHHIFLLETQQCLSGITNKTNFFHLKILFHYLYVLTESEEHQPCVRKEWEKDHWVPTRCTQIVKKELFHCHNCAIDNLHALYVLWFVTEMFLSCKMLNSSFSKRNRKQHTLKFGHVSALLTF